MNTTTTETITTTKTKALVTKIPLDGGAVLEVRTEQGRTGLFESMALVHCGMTLVPFASMIPRLPIEQVEQEMVDVEHAAPLDKIGKPIQPSMEWAHDMMLDRLEDLKSAAYDETQKLKHEGFC